MKRLVLAVGLTLQQVLAGGLRLAAQLRDQARLAYPRVPADHEGVAARPFCAAVHVKAGQFGFATSKRRLGAAEGGEAIEDRSPGERAPHPHGRRKTLEEARPANSKSKAALVDAYVSSDTRTLAGSASPWSREASTIAVPTETPRCRGGPPPCRSQRRRAPARRYRRRPRSGATPRRSPRPRSRRARRRPPRLG